MLASIVQNWKQTPWRTSICINFQPDKLWISAIHKHVEYRVPRSNLPWRTHGNDVLFFSIYSILVHDDRLHEPLFLDLEALGACRIARKQRRPLLCFHSQVDYFPSSHVGSCHESSLQTFVDKYILDCFHFWLCLGSLNN
jgi:hypothetical protein